MIVTSHPRPQPSRQLIEFLELRIGLSEEALKLGIRQANSEQAPLPIVLWSFGLLSLEQYQEVLNWQNEHQ